MAYIVNRAYDFDEQQPLALETCEFIRKISYLGDWNLIRLGGLFSVYPFQTIREVNFEMGMCAGTLNPGSHANGPRHQVGVSWTGDPTPGTTGKTMTIAGTAHYFYQFAASQTRAYRRTPLGVTSASATANQYCIPIDTNPMAVWRALPWDGANTWTGVGGVPRVHPLIIEIDRTAGPSSITVTAYGYLIGTTTGHPFTWRRGDLFRALESRGTPSLHGVALTATAFTLTNLTELFGPLDSIYINWSPRAPWSLLVHALGACVFTRQGASGYENWAGGYDGFEQYFQGSLTTQGTSGYEWGANAFKSFGTAIPLGLRIANTDGTLSMPNDSFENYQVGTILSNQFPSGIVTLSQGTLWAADGIIYPGAYVTG